MGDRGNPKAENTPHYYNQKYFILGINHLASGHYQGYIQDIYLFIRMIEALQHNEQQP